ncbi:hypothetical protein BDB00DRAFT_856639 [Zychaea mexicana]|uniref:uncharacterized protein n=1 Tax=Zychaea mexicana TaxID=64656 RepID=UPI0022FE00C3|nr:uncharacterized protein BDB00DRAFT_856639 [Zychaea mexicana]KAI9484276.1 hypothetical protein BDB00DRAFT_856639 [Zychaea mexicana]
MYFLRKQKCTILPSRSTNMLTPTYKQRLAAHKELYDFAITSHRNGDTYCTHVFRDLIKSLKEVFDKPFIRVYVHHVQGLPKRTAMQQLMDRGFKVLFHKPLWTFGSYETELNVSYLDNMWVVTDSYGVHHEYSRPLLNNDSVWTAEHLYELHRHFARFTSKDQARRNKKIEKKRKQDITRRRQEVIDRLKREGKWGKFPYDNLSEIQPW